MRRLLIAICLVLAVSAAVVWGEYAARRYLDEQAQRQIAGYLIQASGDGAGFADVRADVRGSALPELARGRLGGIDATSGSGLLAGVVLDSLTLSTGVVDLSTRRADGVRVTATIGAPQVTAIAEQNGGLTGAALTATAPDRLVARGQTDGQDVVVDLVVRVQDGAVVADAVALTVAGVAVDPAMVVQTPLLLLAAEAVPAGLSVTAVRATPEGSGAGVAVDLECPAECDLAAG